MTALAQRLGLYARLVRLDKPIGSLLLLWPTLTALWLASNGVPAWYLVVIFAVGTVLMRSAGCAINDYFDRDFDRHVERTRERVLTTGLISGREALGVAGALAFVSFLLVLPLPRLVWGLAVVALVIAITYPLLKRFFSLPQAYLGIAFGFGIPMAYAAVQQALPLEAWLLLLANVAWALAYDTEYAMVDRADDLKLGLRTAAITFGRFDVIGIAACYAITLALLGVVGWRLELAWPYAVGLIAAALIAVRHIGWIRTREREACFRAFLDNTWFGFAVFAGAVVATSGFFSN